MVILQRALMENIAYGWQVDSYFFQIMKRFIREKL